MIPHNCPHCKTCALYSAAIGQQVHCRSCGSGFVLSRFTMLEKSKLLRAYELAQLKLRDLRSSRRLLYAGGGVGLFLLTWLALSVFGLLPDEARLLNRRFVSPEVSRDLDRSVGLVAISHTHADGSKAFVDFYSAASISTDGFMLTSRDTVLAGLLDGMWVLLDGKRYGVEIVDAEGLGDFAIIKVDGELPLKFKLSRIENLQRLNQRVVAIGRQQLADKIDSPLEWPLAVTSGTISRVFVDKLGTAWIEHSAPIGGRAGMGSPLLLGDTIIGINVESEAGISKAISILPHRERIGRIINKWKKEDEK